MTTTHPEMKRPKIVGNYSFRPFQYMQDETKRADGWHVHRKGDSGYQIASIARPNDEYFLISINGQKYEIAEGFDKAAARVIERLEALQEANAHAWVR